VNLTQELSRGIEELGLEISADAQFRMLAYLELLEKWNRIYNLTAIRQPEQMVTHHLLDSLAVLPHLWGGRWLDVGCGAGLPGLVLAMARPGWRFVLLDSNSKKTSFVQQAIIDLDLANAEVHCARAEEWESSEKFDGIISRAFAELSDFIRATRHLLSDSGHWVAMKGRMLEQESKLLPADVRIEQLISLHVPGLKAARHLAILKMDQE
jgi:16S rRNA (guanine527-N7)-methyltransferase